MTDGVNCPADGCDYGPLPRSSVLGHYSGKRDDAHPGGYERAKQLLDGGTDATHDESTGVDTDAGDTGDGEGTEAVTPDNGGPEGGSGQSDDGLGLDGGTDLFGTSDSDDVQGDTDPSDAADADESPTSNDSTDANSGLVMAGLAAVAGAVGLGALASRIGGGDSDDGPEIV